jgi:hypothetical protein
MGCHRSGRPVETAAVPPETSPTAHSGANARPWPDAALPLAQRLHRELCIGDRDWHALKRQRPRRAAEQLAAALVQLLAADDPGSPAPTEGRLQAMALVEHAQAWLRAEISDPGCPSHGR